VRPCLDCVLARLSSSRLRGGDNPREAESGLSIEVLLGRMPYRANLVPALGCGGRPPSVLRSLPLSPSSSGLRFKGRNSSRWQRALTACAIESLLVREPSAKSRHFSGVSLLVCGLRLFGGVWKAFRETAERGNRGVFGCEGKSRRGGPAGSPLRRGAKRLGARGANAPHAPSAPAPGCRPRPSP
jgi:hypothetical protein